MRLLGRKLNELRKVEIETNILLNAEGSCLIMCGNTQVICSATIDKYIPPFLKGKGLGWLTAEYSMLPRSTVQRMKRDSSLGKINGRAQEIQRFIGRSLRSCLDFELLGERQVIIDCDVINADGGTRTASITGGYIALYIAVMNLLSTKQLKVNPIKQQVAAVSCGVIGGNVMVDLDYKEDSNADVDANFVMTNENNIVEIQGGSEKKVFTELQLNEMLDLAKESIQNLLVYQRQACNSI